MVPGDLCRVLPIFHEQIAKRLLYVKVNILRPLLERRSNNDIVFKETVWWLEGSMVGKVTGIRLEHIIADGGVMRSILFLKRFFSVFKIFNW